MLTLPEGQIAHQDRYPQDHGQEVLEHRVLNMDLSRITSVRLAPALPMINDITSASTLSHPMAALVSVGLVKQNRESRTLLCVSQYEVLEEIIAFFREECCVNDKRD